MPVTIESAAPEELRRADLTPRGDVHPSPISWRDQCLYFLMPDRFSDGNEGQRPLFDRGNPAQFKTQDKTSWMKRGRDFQGGTLRGIASKLGYLKDLGVTTLWIGPIWRQRAEGDTYHGYAIQNFLDVDPRFGTRQDLRALVELAHSLNLYVVLDIIYNHTGNNWFYDLEGQPADQAPYRFSPPHPLHGWRTRQGASVKSVVSTEDGVWPREFQNPDWYTRAGSIGKWDPEPWEHLLHPDTEFRRGDFFDLKDLNHKRDEVLSALIKVYRYWIALSDCDGFRIDTVKHLAWEVSRNFCGAIREYAESIGKENFLLLGEVTGGAAMAKDYLDIFGRNLDAVLDIGEPAVRLTNLAKGFEGPTGFFGEFQGHDLLGSHRETGRYHVSILDDHDMVGRGKHRFAANNSSPTRYLQVAHAVGIQLTTLGMPCIYYGTEQAFDGTVDRHDAAIDDGFEDRYIREAMFGGSFGAFETQNCHFFDPEHPSYLRIMAIARLRNQKDRIGKAFRRGRQYLRETSVPGRPFSIPGAGELIAWSRILYDQEAVIALNPHGTESRGAEVTVDNSLHPPGSSLTVLYHSHWTDAQLRKPTPPEAVPVRDREGRAIVRIDLSPAGMMILG